ncbi:zinc-binding dehydrogenase [uncultured Oscillibacter sp.]|uniref:zinc-dependent alcohol dehydrogenase n=1 Tax=uncultured Oscillibacter sp. TaxID=876091 RepID=UPI0025D9B7B9|nr:alcohol dehydrogenase catalytic domain-containing protein [uncultured Oscillibacter sp.]
MKKLVLTDVRKIEIVECPVPEPGPGQAVVRIRYAGICGSDLHVFDGLNANAKMPLVMGHEACGELYSMNDERTDIKVGDKVCAHTIKPCNSCEPCAVGRENLCRQVKIMGTNFDGVFTQYMLVDANRLIKFSDDVDMRLAALVEPLTVGVHDVRRSGLRAGDDVFIAGAGPIGLIIGMMCRLSGAAHVVMGEMNPVRIQMAQSLGFTVANTTDPAAFKAVCDEATDGEGFDKSFEITSVQPGFDMCLAALKKSGVMIQVGMPPKGTVMGVDIDKIIYSECELRGVRHHTMSSMQAAAKIINSGRMNDQLEKLISAVYPMDWYEEALEKARTDKTMLRVLMDFS